MILKANANSLNNNNGLAGYAINKDTLAGAVDGGNLTLNTNTFTFKNLEDHYYTESSAFGFSTSIGYGGNLNQNQGNGASNTAQGQGTAAANNPNQQRNFYPDGSTTLTLQNSSNKKEGTTFATIGSGNVTTNAILNFDANGNLISSTNANLNDQTILANLNRDITKSQVVTKDQITGALDVSVTIDNRMLAAAYEVATGAKAKILNDDSLSKEEKNQAIANLSYSQLANEQTNIGNNIILQGELIASLPEHAILAVSQIATATQKVFNEIGVIFNPEQKNQIDQAIAQGNIQKAQDLLDKFAQGKNLTETQREKLTNFFEGKVSGSEFLAGLTREDKRVILLTDQNQKPTSIGVFFDGTGNDKYNDSQNVLGSLNFDLNKNIESNVARLSYLYNGFEAYVAGVGTSGGMDKLCQGSGCGTSGKQKYISNEILNYYNHEDPRILVIDEIGFSRGAPTAIDHGNQLRLNGISDEKGNQLIPPQYIITRSFLLFDAVASFGIPGNAINIGKNLTLPIDSVAIHATAENEGRNLFGLQSIKFSDGSLLSKKWTEQSFPGNHSDDGGSNAPGYQGKQNDIQFYTLNWMVNQANQNIPSLNEGEKIFNTPSANQQPSAELNDWMNFYFEAKANNDQYNVDAVKELLNQKYIHKETFSLNTFWNYNTGDVRRVYHSNDQLLNK